MTDSSQSNSAAGLSKLRTRSRWTIGFLALFAAVQMVEIVFNGFQLELLGRVRSGGFYTEQEFDMSDMRLALAAGLLVIGFVGSAVSFMMWTFRGHRNLWEQGVSGLRFKPGWAVGWWFVPIWFFWKPYQALKELWRASRAGRNDSWPLADVAPILGFYWACWLLANWGYGYNASFLRDESPDRMYILTVRETVEGVFWIAATALAILMVRDITVSQFRSFGTEAKPVIEPEKPGAVYAEATPAEQIRQVTIAVMPTHSTSPVPLQKDGGAGQVET